MTASRPPDAHFHARR